MYKLTKPLFQGAQVNTVQRLADNAFIPMVEDNVDYQEYLQWLAEGNEPTPADEENT